MPGKKKKKTSERPVFDAVRKPTAPPGQKMGSRRPDEKVHPANRKAKHKGSGKDENDGDL